MTMGGNPTAQPGMGQSLFDSAMELKATDVPNVRQAVPFFNVKDIEASLRFYVTGLGFTIARHWNPEGRVRWCWLELGGAALMLQEYWKEWTAWRLACRPAWPGRIDLLHVRGCDRRLSRRDSAGDRGVEAIRRQQLVGHVVRRSGWLPARLREPHGRSRGYGVLGPRVMRSAAVRSLFRPVSNCEVL